MKLTMFAQIGRNGRRALWGGAVVGLMLAAGATAIGDVTPEGKRLRNAQRDAFSLFAGPTAILQANQLQCGIDNQGNVCTDVFNSPTGGGGFWPTGSPNAYIFNTGLQIAGLIPVDAGFPWAGDTTAAYFFDARGTQQHSAPLESVWDSQNPDDFANWPQEAYVNNPDLFQPVLLGRKTASQQDSWTKYWDGDPLRNANRQHPMGIEVTQRSLAWNYPAGNEVVIYFIYDFGNVTDDPDFQRANELQFFGGENLLPDAGWKYDNLYGSFSTDMDVTSNATQNFSTAILPFDMGISYHGGFNDQTFIYSPTLFFPPFFTASPGIVGVKYLKSPIDPNTGLEVGLTLFSNTQNPSSAGAQFVDPFGDRQLWRYLSGNLDPAQGDPPCNVLPATPTQRTVCFVFQQASDTRFYQASGPFSLDAGDVGTIVVAYIVAATVATLPDGSPSGIIANAASANANPPGFPSFHPGFESTSGCDNNATNCVVSLTAAENAVNSLELGSGWVAYTGPTPTGSLETPEFKLDQFQVTVTPSSLLGRALVAQTIFNNKFLLGFSPDSPPFWLIPGSSSVSIVWNKSVTETTGDPFYQVASDPESSLFNPNYREFDVEGYRIWKGEDKNSLTLLAQFDYSDTEFTDTICETVEALDAVGTQSVDQAGNIVTVNGYATGELCAGTAIANPIQSVDPALVFNNGGAGGLPGSGVVRLNNLEAQEVTMDTVVISDAGEESAPLSNTGVPFVFADGAVVNNFTYWYSVTAFDVNSAASGPISLRSVKQAQQIVPRASAPNLEDAFSFTVAVTGDDDVPLDTSAGNVQLDPDTGVFPSKQPPTNGTVSAFIPDPSQVGNLLKPGGLVAKIDSIVPQTIASATMACPATGGNGLGACWFMYMTFDDGTTVSQSVVEGMSPVWSSFGEPTITVYPMGSGSLPFDDDVLTRFGVPAGAGAGIQAGFTGSFGQSINYSTFEGQANRRGLNHEAGGSRWFDQGTVLGADPTTFIRVGTLAGVDSVWSPMHHTVRAAGGTTYAQSGDMQCLGYTLAFMGRAADYEVTWGAGGTMTMRDITHNVEVPFAPQIRGSYGFMNTDGNANGSIDWNDFEYVEPLRSSNVTNNTFCEFADQGVDPPPSVFEATPVLQQVSLDGDSDPFAGVIPNGQGFALYTPGQAFIFLTNSLPAEGTVWVLRTYTGIVTADDWLTDDPSNYNLTGGTGGSGTTRPPLITNMQFVLAIDSAGSYDTGIPDLTQVHTVPDPYLATSAYDLAPTTKQLMFVNLPVRATLRLYSLTGILVDVLEHEDTTGGGRLVWDVRNRNNQFVASGVYFFHVITPEGYEHVGKFTIVNSAGQN